MPAAGKGTLLIVDVGRLRPTPSSTDRRAAPDPPARGRRPPHANQRTKLERYGDHFHVAVHAAASTTTTLWSRRSTSCSARTGCSRSASRVERRRRRWTSTRSQRRFERVRLECDDDDLGCRALGAARRDRRPLLRRHRPRRRAARRHRGGRLRRRAPRRDPAGGLRAAPVASCGSGAPRRPLREVLADAPPPRGRMARPDVASCSCRTSTTTRSASPSSSSPSATCSPACSRRTSRWCRTA